MTASTPHPKDTLPANLNVLQVLPRLADGGVEQSTLEMAEWLKNQGIPQAVASAPGAKVAILNKLGVAHISLPLGGKNPLKIISNAWALRQAIKQHGITLVHARSRAPAWSAWLATRHLKTAQGHPVVFLTTFHGTYGCKNIFKRTYNRVMLRGPVTIANSQFIRQHLEETYHYPANKIIVAPRGINPNTFNPTLFSAEQVNNLRQQLGLKPGIPTLLAVGRLARWKGQDIILQALSQISDLPWQALIVGAPDGTGQFAAELHQQSQTLSFGQTDYQRVIFTGSRTDIPALLACSTLGISASIRAEAFGRVAIETMAMGKPVVATALGGSLETVIDGKTGYLVAPKSPHSLAERLRHLLTHAHEQETLGHNARQHVCQHYTVENCCQQEAKAYAKAFSLVLDQPRATFGKTE